MNYAAHYQRLIHRAQYRAPFKPCEKHHAIPRCMGGTDEAHNIARLTPEEHFVAHQLLVKIFPDEPKLVFALRQMSGKGHAKLIRNNKLYSWIRARVVMASRQTMLGKKFKPWCQEARDRLSARQTGKKRGPMSEETKQKIGAGNKGKVRNPAHIKALSDAKRGRSLNVEHRAKISDALKGRPTSDEHRRKLSEAAKARYA